LSKNFWAKKVFLFSDICHLCKNQYFDMILYIAFGDTVTRAIAQPKGETSEVVLPGLGVSSPRYYSVYIIVVFFLFYRIVCESEGTQRSGGMVGSLALYNTGNRNIALERRGWRARGSAAANPESSSPRTEIPEI